MVRRRQAKRGGFTLIEMLIVVVIVAALAAIALPSYEAHMRKERRASAEAHLMEIVGKEQAYLLDTRNGYSSSLSTLKLATPTHVSTYYTISITVTAGPPPSFTATAAPAAGQNQDLGGQSLTVTNTGERGPCIDLSTDAYTAAPCGAGTRPAW